MDINSLNHQNFSSFLHNKNESEVNSKKRDNGNNYFFDNMGFDTFFISQDNPQYNEENVNEKGSKTNIKNERQFDKKKLTDLFDIKNSKIHKYLSEDLIKEIDKSFDDPKEISDTSLNEAETNYSQLNLSNNNESINSYSNNSLKYYTNNLNVNNNSANFSQQIQNNKQNEENNKNTINDKIVNNHDDVEKDDKESKKLKDFFGANNPLDTPLYIPQKFKLNQNQNEVQNSLVIGDFSFHTSQINNANNIIGNNDIDSKEEKYKKPFEIREGDWTCEFCFNLNFAFRTKCNRCGQSKDMFNIRNMYMNNSYCNFQNYKNIFQQNYSVNTQNSNSFQYMKGNQFICNNFYPPNYFG